MSILLVGLSESLARVLSRRLIAQGDEVRVLVAGGLTQPELPGVHVASGQYLDDADLIERACQNVRTVVLGEDLPSPRSDHLGPLIQGARAADVSRIVYYDPAPDLSIVEPLRTSDLEYVILAGGRSGLLRRASVHDDEDVAEAIDAADDTSGDLHLELDLTQPSGWEALKLSPR